MHSASAEGPRCSVKILVTAFGSLGDVEPYLAVASALLRRGHEVRVATLDHFASRVEALGLPFESLRVEWDEPRFDSMMREVLRKKNPFAQARIIFSRTHDALVTATKTLVPMAEASDVVLTHIFHLGGYAAAQLARKPFVSGHLITGMIPSNARSPIGSDFGALGNKLRRRALDSGIRRATDTSVNAVLSAVNLPPLKDALRRGLHSPVLNLIAVSESVRPRDPEWDGRYSMTGAWRIKQHVMLPAKLDAFLRAGPSPLFVTLGSTVGFDIEKLSRVLLAGLEGTRAVIQSGSAKLKVQSDQHFLLDEYVAYDALLPFVCGVIHHGGAGTTAACMYHGKPMAIACALGDQHAWGVLTERLQVSSGTRWLSQLNAKWIRQAIATLPTENAKLLGLQLASEPDGAEEAALRIEQLR